MSVRASARRSAGVRGAGGFVVGGLGGAERGADHVAGGGVEGALDLGAAFEGLGRVQRAVGFVGFAVVEQGVGSVAPQLHGAGGLLHAHALEDGEEVGSVLGEQFARLVADVGDDRLDLPAGESAAIPRASLASNWSRS